MDQFRNTGFMYQQFDVLSLGSCYFLWSHCRTDPAHIRHFAFPSLYMNVLVKFPIFFPFSGAVWKLVKMKPFAGQKQPNYKKSNSREQ
jgi:hypothetical protein